jgi:hypothetical protein
MTDDPGPAGPADRAEPVGEPVVRADPEVTGDRAERAVEFDPDDPESVAHAAETVRRFAAAEDGPDDRGDSVYVLRGAAACAALTRGVGSYTAAAERAGEAVTVAFVRKWARVHDLPQAVRRQVARGAIAPTAAKQIARVRGEARLALAWATVDAGLTVREVRRVASRIADGAPVGAALEEVDAAYGRLTLDLPPEQYLDLRRRASLRDDPPGAVVAEALAARFEPPSE